MTKSESWNNIHQCHCEEQSDEAIWSPTGQFLYGDKIASLRSQ